jgi:hypothetical protein
MSGDVLGLCTTRSAGKNRRDHRTGTEVTEDFLTELCIADTENRGLLALPQRTGLVEQVAEEFVHF